MVCPLSLIHIYNVIQTMGRKAAAKIPFASMLLQPSIDEWGRQDVEGNAGMRFVENFLSPGYIGEWESSKMEDELQRLYDTTGEKSVLPTTAAKYFNVGERRFDLSYEDYKTYAQKLGKTRYQLITDMVDSSLWRDLDDEQKVQAIEKAYEYSNAVAKAVSYTHLSWLGKKESRRRAGSLETQTVRLLIWFLSLIHILQ